jgi:hypothetical protein
LPTTNPGSPPVCWHPESAGLGSCCGNCTP